MLKKLKDILNTYTDEELEDEGLWVDSNKVVDTIIVGEYGIDLITDGTEIKINGFIDKEGRLNE